MPASRWSVSISVKHWQTTRSMASHCGCVRGNGSATLLLNAYVSVIQSKAAHLEAPSTWPDMPLEWSAAVVVLGDDPAPFASQEYKQQ